MTETKTKTITNKQRLNKLPNNQRTEHIVLKTVEMAFKYGANCAYKEFYKWYNQEIEVKSQDKKGE